MPITLTYDQRDAAPEEIREQLAEKDGKFIFEVEPASVAAEAASKLKKLRGDLDSKAAELGKLMKFKSVTDLLAEADEAELEEFQASWQKRGEKGNNKGAPPVDDAREKVHQREIKKLTEERDKASADLQKAQGELKQFKLWVPLRELFVSEKVGGSASDWELAQLDLANQGKFGFDEEGRIVVMEDGYPSSVSPEKFLKEVYSEQRPKFYKASSAAGSGAQNNTAPRGNGKTINRAAFEQMGASERMKFVKEGGVITD
jgi:hypothetical protein